MHKPNRQAGDTIVEVIIAVAVVATILAGAFLVTTRSTRSVRDSEEHAQALQYLQGQVELLRYAAFNHGLPPDITQKFCLGAGAYYTGADTNPSCLASNLYRLAIIEHGPPSATTTTFDLTANWSSLSGNTDAVYLSYKVAVTP